MLRWVFRRQDRFVTCELDATPRGQYEVCVIPHWNVQASVVEDRPDVMTAVERHAQLARRFREAGWTVVHPTSRRLAA